jgi:hypothetical protein
MNEPYRKKTLYMQRKRQKDAPSVDIAPDSTWGEARVKPRERRDVRKATLSKATRLQARTARRGVGDPPPPTVAPTRRPTVLTLYALDGGGWGERRRHRDAHLGKRCAHALLPRVRLGGRARPLRDDAADASSLPPY